jgi:hypothetical protein
MRHPRSCRRDRAPARGSARTGLPVQPRRRPVMLKTWHGTATHDTEPDAETDSRASSRNYGTAGGVSRCERPKAATPRPSRP